MLVDEGGELLEVNIDNSIFYFNELNRGGLTYPSSTVLYGFNLLMQFLTLADAFQEILKNFL